MLDTLKIPSRAPQEPGEVPKLAESLYGAVDTVLNRSSHLSERIMSTTLNRLQEAKQRTREEFTRNINQMLQGSSLDRMIGMLCWSSASIRVSDYFDNKD